MKKRALLVGALFLCLLFPFSTSAFAYSQVVAFGDSLSDNGDGFVRASNGPVWVDYLAADLGIGLLDMAYSGARTYGHPASGTEPGTTGYDYGFTWQIDEYLSGDNFDKNALHTVWIGGNDLLNLGEDRPREVIWNAAINIGHSVGKLAAAGANDIVLMNMPNLGATPLMNGENLWATGLFGPDVIFTDTPEYGEALSKGFNCSLAITQAIMEWCLPDLNLFSIDIFALMDEFIASDVFADTTHMGILDQANADGYLFWDAIHPTTFAHGLIADAVYSQVAPVPEPSTIVLMGLGLVGLAGLGRKKFRK
jgi:phospholipase/lecithinase/hemolysin